MTPAILGMYGVYMILVGFHGNVEAFLQKIGEEKGFVDWLVAILILGFLNSTQETHKLVAPFTVLLIVAAIVTHEQQVKTDVANAYKYLTGA